MLTYTLRRLAYLVPTLLGITIVTFLIINLAPGDPVSVIQGGQIQARISPEAYQQMVKHYGLDKPIHVRYLTWLLRLLTF
ncbi:MAG: diguanylate cyclase, partial [Candidatus Krumholzibacteria bacterium]|nr:diguanylate cyclase [Candidatus Krumholzibacteria bacterium]